MSLKAQSVILKSFQDLDKEELYKFLQLRIEVFVVEQNCPYQDFDDLDQEAQHMWIEEEGEVICYLRINSPGTKFDEPSLGRIVTKATHRSQGLAAQLIYEGLKVIQETYGRPTMISAQSHLQDYYGTFGFETCSEEYLEDDIPHVNMIRHAKD